MAVPMLKCCIAVDLCSFNRRAFAAFSGSAEDLLQATHFTLFRTIRCGSRRFIAAAVLIVMPVYVPWSDAFSLHAQDRQPLEAALECFLITDTLKFETVLEDIWTPPASAESITAALISFQNTAPEGGEIKKLDVGDRRKIAALQPVLRLFKRQQLQVKVLSIIQAYVGLYKRAIILVSQSTLQLLNPEELQAMFAHEAAHDFIWAKWEAARTANDLRSLHELELFCDGMAILALNSLDIDPSRWIAALDKIATYNRRRFGGNSHDEDRYPSMSDRRQFAEAVIRRIHELGETNGQAD